MFTTSSQVRVAAQTSRETGFPEPLDFHQVFSRMPATEQKQTIRRATPRRDRPPGKREENEVRSTYLPRRRKEWPSQPEEALLKKRSIRKKAGQTWTPLKIVVTRNNTAPPAVNPRIVRKRAVTRSIGTISTTSVGLYKQADKA